MKRLLTITCALAMTGAIGCANADDLGGTRAAHKQADAGKPPPPPPPTFPCRVTGGGQIMAGDNPDSFGGNAQPFRRGVDGEWNHVTHEGQHFHGDPDTITCWQVDGPPADPPSAPANAVEFSGVGSFAGSEECDFTVYIEDHGEPGVDDWYSIEITCGADTTYAAADTLMHGNLQIHAVPPGHLPNGGS